jgi:hypothetical protein
MNQFSYGYEPFEPPDITRHDRARFVKEARRLRAAEIDKLLSILGRGIARLAGRATKPGTATP